MRDGLLIFDLHKSCAQFVDIFSPKNAHKSNVFVVGGLVNEVCEQHTIPYVCLVKLPKYGKIVKKVVHSSMSNQERIGCG